ncbi:FKBP-type peptidyl-prolyl cis-trans isomerase [Pedobacter cryoconitis]|uniref:Peptidyl-prolyl cis-trans isomerase n=1 Tax=Pedobacter cryoconitis TaxID=188932 RepID=A0A7X0MLG2_9SPHI|nr:FKBP-type peptidyl-prolyl cis-trans isomerase [Pedobacter cryoconitis]MBB6501378.1 FKBP-type peptidyl-prolyl cis-trans isomerase FkpA [Pedobacter cryoconitis]
MLKSKSLLLIIVVACFFAACKTGPAYDKATQFAIDEALIQHYVDSLKLPMTKSPEGLYYQVINQGGAKVTIDPALDTVQVRYIGRVMNSGVLYDSTATLVDSLATKFVLNTAIEGWQRGIPLIGPGGQIRLIVPSTMAYQNVVVSALPAANGTSVFLPANTILDFNIRYIKLFKYKKPQVQPQ